MLRGVRDGLGKGVDLLREVVMMDEGDHDGQETSANDAYPPDIQEPKDGELWINWKGGIGGLAPSAASGGSPGKPGYKKLEGKHEDSGEEGDAGFTLKQAKAMSKGLGDGTVLGDEVDAAVTKEERDKPHQQGKDDDPRLRCCLDHNDEVGGDDELNDCDCGGDKAKDERVMAMTAKAMVKGVP